MTNRKFVKYVELTKPKVTLLNLLVGVTCFALATLPQVNLLRLSVFALAGYLSCGGCGVLNCVYDRDVDRLMPRTSKRAIPSGTISPINALSYGSILLLSGICISFIVFNAITAVMMALGAVFYLVVYTIYLKSRSSLNVVIGGVAGCFAALAGWTAASNSLSLLPLLVSTVDFLWTPGHLWGLAMKKIKEYKAAGIPMLPVTVGIKKAAQTTFMLNLLVVASSLTLPVLGVSGLIYCFVALSAGIWFLLENRRLLAFPSESGGFQIFSASMPYLAILMVGLLVDRLFFARIL